MSKSNAVKLDWETISKIKELEIEMWWVRLKTYDDKINHLIWFYQSNKNNNHIK